MDFLKLIFVKTMEFIAQVLSPPAPVHHHQDIWTTAMILNKRGLDKNHIRALREANYVYDECRER